jgi:PIN domain nuclease of toxin-antitoxin system
MGASSVRLLLDTVTFIWAVDSPQRISRKAMAALKDNETVREMSAISLSEIAIKGALGKLNLSIEDVLLGIADLRMRILPYTADHAGRLFGLPLHHADPFDRQIIAQALSENIPVVTSDEKFRLYKRIKVIW